MPMHTKIKEAADRVGPERVLYGSDAPFHHPAVEILRVQVSGLEPGELNQVLSTNARSLFLGEGSGDDQEVKTSASTDNGGRLAGTTREGSKDG